MKPLKRMMFPVYMAVTVLERMAMEVPAPKGKHRYFFHVYALDAELNLPPGSSKKDIQDAMQGHILAKADLMGLYQQKSK
jgi:phosphatidylethanolamine-binding protein (PEBP) family uncharacterized protein